MLDGSDPAARISLNVSKRLADAARPHSNLGSWARCYRMFGDSTCTDDQLALQLGYFLASWGMMRGSAFLKGCDYTVHLGVVAFLRTKSAQMLRSVCPQPGDIEAILTAKNAIEEQYTREGLEEDVSVTDTLSSKIMLAALGCVPAYDRFLVAGLRSADVSGRFARRSISQILDYVEANRNSLELARARLSSSVEFDAPMMRVIDMHFGLKAGSRVKKTIPMMTGDWARL